MKRIAKWYKIVFVLVALLIVGRGIQLAQAAPLADEDVDALIANAESAGTSVIAKDATILTWDDDGMPSVVLREGTNGWTCLSDWPVSPGNDPQCFDPIWEAWNEAYAAGEEPEVTGLGIGYMLQGGSDPSNTDPMAMEPAAGEEWVTSPPHIMFLMPDGFDADFFSTTPGDSVPYIMWDGTPYEHLMVPVVAITAEEMGDASGEMASAMSAAPADIALNATIMGNPETAGDPMVVLQEGTNGWICYPDGTGSPGNDPACQDPDFDAGFANSTTTKVPGLRIGYMLQGGSDASNTDLTISAPAPGQEWVVAPAHVMAMIPGGFDPSYYTTDYNSGYPYIMMDGTDVEHLMIPVADMPATGDDALKAQMLANEIGTFDHLIAHNVAATKAEIAEDFVWINADGERKGREDLLADVGNMALTFQQPVRDDINVQILGPETVMVVYTLEFQGSYDGEPFTGNEYTTSIWQKRGARWLNTFLQSTARKEAAAITAKIANAESAAPSAIAKDATIIDWAEDGSPSVILREGTNGWTCVTDWPVSPGNDPQCNDATWQKWSKAFGGGTEPEIDGPGIAYMLAGGSDPSNTDPMAMEPAEGEEWISTPPHIMILAPGGFDAAQYPTEPKQDEPYIMWDGTPYEHLMVPVVAITAEEMGDVDADLANTMSSAPAGIVHKAKIMGSPTTEGGEMVVLQEGDSGWVCYPDRAVSPGNDPSCNDSMWEELFGSAEPPAITRTGVSYMLAGGSDESNTDPMATAPEPGAEWISTPHHIMLLTPGGFDPSNFTTDHGSGYPYIMWDGTPYEHLMIPVADMPAMADMP